MKILVIYRVNTADKSNLGVIHKMNAQVKAFKEFGKIDIANLSDGKILLNKEILKTYSSYSLAAFQFYRVLKSVIRAKDYDLIYIRYGASTFSFIQFLKSLDGNIVIEMPTYPYDKEYKGLINTLRLYIDKLYRNQLKRYVHAITHLGTEKEVLGIPTITIQNGIDTKLYQPSDFPFNKDRINLIAVGKWTFRHGLDRLIKGIGNYTKDGKSFTPVYLRVIGEGPELPRLQKMVTDLKLSKYISFHGIQEGETLNKLFEDADLGVGILAFHRVKIIENSAIKHREYLSRGLPVLKAGIDRGIDRYELVVNVPSDESDLDMSYVVKEYLSIVNGRVKKKIAENTKDDLNWTKCAKKILEKVQLL